MPTCKLPKFKLVGAATNWPATIPVPLTATVVVVLLAVVALGELWDWPGANSEAALTTATFPLTVPLCFGVKVTAKETLWLGASVAGRVGPLIVNPVPLVESWEIVKSEPPGLVNVPLTVWLFPTCTLPKLILDGLTASWPGFTAVPVNVIVVEGSGALLASVIVPWLFPAAVGE